MYQLTLSEKYLILVGRGLIRFHARIYSDIKAGRLDKVPPEIKNLVIGSSADALQAGK